jgi:hypothetical protein
MDAEARRRCAPKRTVKPRGPDTSTLVPSEWRCDFGFAADAQMSIRDGD